MGFSHELHMVVPMLAEQQEIIYVSSVKTLDAVWKNCCERRMMERERERERERVREIGANGANWCG